MDTTPHYTDDSIDFTDLLRRMRRGLPLILGLAFTGLALGTLISLAVTTKPSAVSTLRVTFGFPGFERGTYPNGTKFQPDDVRAPDVSTKPSSTWGFRTGRPNYPARFAAPSASAAWSRPM